MRLISFPFKFFFCTLFLLHAQILSALPQIIVAQDGSGHYKSVNEAIASLPDGRLDRQVIRIKKGIYNEKIFITKNNLVLRGDHKDSVTIIFAELRKNWRKNHDSDYGSAVINIAPDVTNLTFSGLTVHNNYGSLYGDHDHQFAIRGGGSRIIIVACKVISDGGDALSLWNARSGMYYHADCYFEGYVDYVCPRGWCFIENSRFFGHNLSASIWMDGDMDSSQKFVLKNCYFDGVPGFPLGRHHREAAFYLLDCTFSKNMADKPIYFCGPSPIKYPGRYYYSNCKGERENFNWFASNLQQSEADMLTPVTVFNGKWDPVSEILQMKANGQL